MNTTTPIMLVSADLINPTFASNMRANPFSRQRAVYLQQHDRRMREFKDRPYLRHVYPEIPAHRPGTWQAYSWNEIDTVVTRLSKLPDRWVTHLDRRRATSTSVLEPSTGRSIKDPPASAVKRSKECSDHIDRLSRPKSSPTRRSETVFYIGGNRNGRDKISETSTDKFEPTETVSVKGILIEKDNKQENERFRPASRPPGKTRLAYSSSGNITKKESGERKQVDFRQNENKTKQNPAQSQENYEASKTILLRCKSAPPRKVRYLDLSPPPLVDIEAKSKNKEVHFTDSLFPDDSKPQGDDVVTPKVVEANMKFGFTERKPSITSASSVSSSKTTASKEQHWSFDSNSASVVSSVLGLLQTVTSNNGRIRPSSAMSSYREKFPLQA